MKIVRAAIVVVALVGAGIGVGAQQAGFKRTVIQQADISVPGREVVTALVEFQPAGTVGPHTHPGEEVAYVLEGTLLVEMAGKQIGRAHV